MVTTGPSSTCSGDTPAESVAFGPMMHPSPISIDDSPNNADTGKQIALRAPNRANRCARRCPGRIVPTSIAHDQPACTTSPSRRRTRSRGPSGTGRSVVAAPTTACPSPGVASFRLAVRAGDGQVAHPDGRECHVDGEDVQPAVAELCRVDSLALAVDVPGVP